MIRPLDLQPLYMNLDKVGKEAAQNRDNVHNQQLEGAQRLAREHDHIQHSVGKTAAGSEVSDGSSGQVNADGGNKGSGHRRGHGHSAEPEADPEAKNAKGFEDPELGRHIDFSG